MQDTSQTFIGVDVAKATLSSCVHGQSQHRDFDNDQASIEAWLQTLPPGSVVAMESTGRYHRLLAALAHAHGHRVLVLNAADVYFYAKAMGSRGKTDRTDAQIIARYAAEHHRSLKAWAPGSAASMQLHELMRCRAGVVGKRMSLRQILNGVPQLRQAVQRLEEQFDELLGRIDEELADLLAQDESLREGCAALGTITGFGPQGSTLVGALLSRIEFANADALVAYSGMDPRANDSGNKTGRRRISKRGSPELRRQMYLAALSAAHSKALGPLYRSIKAKGFKPTQALVILARKLLRVAWAIWKSRKPFDPKLVGADPTCAKA